MISSEFPQFSDFPTSPPVEVALYSGIVDWSYLAPHSKTGALLFVDPSITLEEVGKAITSDQSDRVSEWMKKGDVVKMEEIHAAQWDGTSTLFEAMVVSPFVLCRPAANP